MDINEMINDLDAMVIKLRHHIPFVWHYARKPVGNPLQPASGRSALSIPFDQLKAVAKGKNWFYADVHFPKSLYGFQCGNTKALMTIWGWIPFTLWIDGREQFKEQHAWMATGPIVSPIHIPMASAKPVRLVLCLEAPEWPHLNPVFYIQITPEACMKMALLVSAAAAQLKFASVLAKTEEESKQVLKAAKCINFNALSHYQWNDVLESFERMEQALFFLSDRAKSVTVHCIGHSHIDMDWQWPWKDTVHCIRRDFKSVLDIQDDYPEVTFIHSQIPTYEVIRRRDPDLFQKVKNRIAAGRWENAAGTWVEGDLYMADGESIVRHIQCAAAWSMKHLGVKAGIIWEPDTFGHPGNMPQIAKLGEFKGYFHLRCNPGHIANDPSRRANWQIRRWVGADGTSVIALSTNYSHIMDPMPIINSAIECHPHGLKNALLVWGLGDHGGALQRWELEELRLYRNKPLIPTISFSTVDRVLEAVSAEKKRLPVNHGETFTIFEGCFTTHADIKKSNRLGENALLKAETFSALAGLNRNKILHEAWTLILFNQFHDLLDGAAIRGSYRECRRRARRSFKTAQEVADESLARLCPNSAAGRLLTVYNPLGFDRTEPVQAIMPAGALCLMDDEGKIIPIQRIKGKFVFLAEHIPAFSGRQYRVLSNIPSGFSGENVPVTNDSYSYRIETSSAVAHIIRESGIIGSYYDKQLQRDFIAYGMPKPDSGCNAVRADLAMNVFQILDESPNKMSAWMVNNISREENLLNASVRLVATGPVFACIEVKHAFRASRLKEYILFYHHYPRVDLNLVIDWMEKGDATKGVPQLKLSFGSAVRNPRLRVEGPFYSSVKPVNGLDQPTQKWADITGDESGFAILNDSKYGCDALGSRLRIPLLRSSYTPDPKPDSGRHCVSLAFLPHQPALSTAELVKAGMAFNRLLTPVLTNRKQLKCKPRLRVEGTGSVVCTAFKQADHSSGYLIRFMETDGKSAEIQFAFARGIKNAREVNFLENPLPNKCRIQNKHVLARFRPFEIKSFVFVT